MELDNENNRTVLLRESDPFMPILPSPERQEEFLEEGLKTPPSTPIPSPHAFLKEDRWLFSPPPVLTPENTNLDKSETKTDTTLHDTDIYIYILFSYILLIQHIQYVHVNDNVLM